MKRYSLVVFCGAILAVSCVASAQIKMTRWVPAFSGVDQAAGKIEGKDASVFYVMRVDLQAKGIEFVGTPHEGSLDTVSETTSNFLKKSNAQIAINGGFFSPCCVASPEAKHIEGLSITDGQIVSKPFEVSKKLAKGKDYTESLLVMKDNKAEIVNVTPATDLSHVWFALTGSAMIVKDGKNNGSETNLNKADTPNPRTAIGLSADGRYMYLLVVDGRKPGYSIGTTNTETAEILLALHVANALNIDGGGSTTMVKSDGKGGVVAVNHPSGKGVERYDANQLGVRALPLQK